jgi:hypothetical protein
MMRHPIQIVVTLALSCVCLADDQAETERRVTAAYHAASGLVGTAEYDLGHLIHDENRRFLDEKTENGGTIRAGHSAVKADLEKVVAELGDVMGKFAETAALIRELARLGSAEMELVLGSAPIDRAFVGKAAELGGQTMRINAKLFLLLPPDTERDPPPSNTY